MKKFAPKKLLIYLLLVSPIIFVGCVKDLFCDGMGTLQLSNKSLNTVQKITVDGINYGTIDPGESKDIKLAPGQHLFEQAGISGGTGCSSGYVIIVECETSSYSCSG